MVLLDLRTFLKRAEEIGELQVIDGADPNLEIGAITELALQHDGPALLFDNIPGYPAGYRVTANVTCGTRRGLLALDMDPNMSEDEAMALFKKQWDNYKPVPPRFVESAPVMENVQTGDEVDLLQFPVPLWHEKDAGPYIGTGLAVIHQDRENGFTNVGCYRVQLHDPDDSRSSVVQSRWLLNPLRPIEDRISRRPMPYKRMVLNGCRPFDRLKDFPPVNKFSEERRTATWDEWNMADWLGRVTRLN